MDLLSNDISDSKNDSNNPKIDDNFFKQVIKGTTMPNHPLPYLESENVDEKIRERKKKKDNRKYQRDRREVVRRGGRIMELSIY